VKAGKIYTHLTTQEMYLKSFQSSQSNKYINILSMLAYFTTVGENLHFTKSGTAASHFLLLQTCLHALTNVDLATAAGI